MQYSIYISRARHVLKRLLIAMQFIISTCNWIPLMMISITINIAFGFWGFPHLLTVEKCIVWHIVPTFLYMDSGYLYYC